MRTRHSRSSGFTGAIAAGMSVVLLAACSLAAPQATGSPPTATPSGSSAEAPTPGVAPRPDVTAAVDLPAVADVPAYKGDSARTGVHPGPGPVAAPVEVWQTGLECSIQERTAVVGSGLVFIGCDRPLLFALDAHTGVERWRADLDGPIFASAAVGDGAVFAADSSGNLSSFDLATGETRWSMPVGATGGWMVVVDGLVYLATDDGFLGVAADDGSVRWTWQPSVSSVRHGTVVGDTAFIATNDGQFHAVSLADGTERWSVQVISGAATSPSISGDTVYIGAQQDGPEPNGELYAVDIASGEIRWRYRPPSGDQIGSCIVSDGTLYAPTYSDGLFAFDAQGNILWNAPTPEGFCPLAKAGEVIYLFGGRALSALGASDGRKLWEMDLGAFTRSGPVVTGGLAILGDDAGVVHAFAEPSIAALLPARPTAGPTITPDASGAPLGVLEQSAVFDAASSELSHPVGMDVGPDGNLYVVNAHESEIVVLAPDGSIVRRWGSSGSREGEFNFRRDAGDPDGDIGGVAVSGDGLVYVADPANRRIQQFDPQGEFIRQWGRFGTGEGQFVDPIDLDVGPDGTVYVVDDQRDDIQAFTSEGAFIRVIGEHGTGPGQMNFTGGIFVGPDGTVYNADWGNDRVQAWDSTGEFLWTLGGRGTGPGQFESPGDVVVDASGTLYVADRHRVQAFDAQSELIATWKVGRELFFMAVAGETIFVGSPWTDHIYALTLDE